MIGKRAAPAPDRRLLERARVTSQAQLVELLAADGVVATQATVSRDLEDLGAVKVRVPGGETVYAIPELPKDQPAPEDHLRRVLGEWVGRGRPLRQPRRAAHAARVAPTSSAPRSTGPALDGILGTVAGDDTLIVVVAETTGGEAVADACPSSPASTFADPSQKEQSSSWQSEWCSPTAAASTPPSPSSG